MAKGDGTQAPRLPLVAPCSAPRNASRLPGLMAVIIRCHARRVKALSRIWPHVQSQVYDNDRIALLTIPWQEIEYYSPMYNPSILALEDMRLTTNTAISIVLKVYPEGKVTGKIRSNFGKPIAAKLAESFSGGGHDYASGFKLTNNPDTEKLKKDIVSKSKELLDALV